MTLKEELLSLHQQQITTGEGQTIRKTLSFTLRQLDRGVRVFRVETFISCPQ